jgi:hypothetical protein
MSDRTQDGAQPPAAPAAPAGAGGGSAGRRPAAPGTYDNSGRRIAVQAPDWDPLPPDDVIRRHH